MTITENTITEAQPAATEQAPTLEERVLLIAGIVTGHESTAADLKAEAAKHQAEADSYKVELLQLLDVGAHTFGNIKVTVTKPSRRFDADAFKKSYPVEANPALYTYVINGEAVPPNLKKQFMAAGTGDLKVSVK